MSDIDIRSDRTAELSLLSACLWSKTAREAAKRIIGPGDFDHPQHEDIWIAMSMLDHKGTKVDATTLMAYLGSNKAAIRTVPDIIAAGGVPDLVDDYANIVHGWSMRRRIELAARETLAQSMSADVEPAGLATRVVNKFTAIRDSTVTDQLTAIRATELLEQEDDEPEWLIPGLLERRDRFMLTGEEGLGKSHLLRQFAVHAAAGLNPLNQDHRFQPLSTLIIDCENTWSQVRRKLRPMVDWTRGRTESPADRITVDCTTRIDITRDKDLARIHQTLDTCNPDLVVIGPLYRLTSKAIQTDDEAAPILAALDTIRDRGCALLMEAHAGHAIGKHGQRDLRPRGSSALLGWPEFGYGMRAVATGYADLVQWRGPREEREWPGRLRKGDGFRWVPHIDHYAYDGGVA